MGFELEVIVRLVLGSGLLIIRRKVCKVLGLIPGKFNMGLAMLSMFYLLETLPACAYGPSGLTEQFAYLTTRMESHFMRGS
jgi:hypothetical protein